MTAKIIPLAPPLKIKCAHCTKLFIKAHISNEPAYCSYHCAALSQPEYTLTERFGPRNH